MTKREKLIAEIYSQEPFLKHKEIAERVGCHRQYVTAALSKPDVKEYYQALMKETFKDAQVRAMNTMVQLAEQSHNLQIRYKATEFLLKASGIGIEQKVKVEADDSINIKIE